MRAARELQRTQSGYVLVVLSIVVAAMMIGVLHTLDSATLRAAQSVRTMQALQEAKESLIATAALNDTAPGLMPCPEDTNRIGTSTEGTQSSSCNTTDRLIGRLPWRTLKLPQLPDGTGEQLWYALSPGFRNALNPLTSNGQIIMNGQQDVVAIIFAPGPTLAGQSRPVPTKDTPPSVANYLDGTNNDNSDGLHSFSTNAIESNDIAVVITVAELTSSIIGRVLAEIGGSTPQRRGLLGYYDLYGDFPAPSSGQRYPYNTADAQPEPTAHNWLLSNGWYTIIRYMQTSSSATLSVNHSCWSHSMQYSLPTPVGTRTRLAISC